MDLIIYCIILAAIGVMRITSTRDVPDSVGITDSCSTTTINCELPVAQNLELKREENAFTIILEQLGLMKCL